MQYQIYSMNKLISKLNKSDTVYLNNNLECTRMGVTFVPMIMGHKPIIRKFGYYLFVVFSVIVNHYFQVSFNLKATLYLSKITQNAVTELL